MSAVPPARPELGTAVPGWSVRVLFAAIAVALCIGLAQPGFWLAVSLLLVAAAVVIPRWLTAWFLIGALALTALGRDPSVLDWRIYALIAGANALHVLASWMLVIGASATVQPSALWPSARRLLLVQAAVQPVAVGALALTSASTGRSLAVFAVVGGLSVAALVIVLAAPLVRRQEP
ncbi:hypothetical protein ACFVWR_05070 [Leifsonia sp. NPDC058292]|uniref:hypothetical protein n=1 Tax=Leifsonia sp. NPDC058292 TaxID=3346428 RepID=UPI0036DB4EBE